MCIKIESCHSQLDRIYFLSPSYANMAQFNFTLVTLLKRVQATSQNVFKATQFRR